MRIESESVVESVTVNQGKTRAVNKAEILVIVSHENCLGRLFNRLTNTKDFDPGLIKALHEVDSRVAADSEANQGIGLGEDEIGC